MATGALAELVLRISGQDNASPAVTSMGAKIKAELGSIGKLAAGMALGNIGANLGMGLAQRFQEAATQIDTYGKAVLQVQRITGGTAEQSSELVAMFQRFTPSLDEAVTRLGRFERSLAGADDALDLVSTGGKTGVQYLRQFGVQVTDSENRIRPTTDILLDLAEGFKNSGDAAAKNGALTALFGRGSQGMLLMLNQGRVGLQQFMADMQKYGLVLSQDNTKDVAAFIAAHKNMDMALQGVSLQLGAAFMPAITASASAISRFAQILNETVMPGIKQIPALLPVLTFGLGVLLFVAAGNATRAFLGFALQGVGAVIGGAVRVSLALAPLIAGYAATAAAATAAAAAQVAAWLAAAGPIVLIIAGIALAAGAVALALSGKFGEAKDAIGNAFNQLGIAVKTGWDTIRKLTDPTAYAAGAETGEQYGDGATAAVETAAQKAAKKAKEAVDIALKGVQDAAAERKEKFEISNIEPNRAALEARLDEVQATQAMLPMKRQLEDLDRAALDYAHQRLVINQDELATQARIGEEKLKNAADDLSYQEKLLLAQARAAKMRGENVDMDALRQKVLAIRTAQIEGEPGLLIAGHNTALADRAKSATGLTDQVAKDELEKRKIAIQEANQPLQDELTLRKRMTEDAQNLLELDKLRFDITETFYARDLLLAQIAAKAADEAYQKAVAAATAAGVAPGTAPLPAGVAGSGTATTTAPSAVVNQTVNIDGASADVAESLKKAAMDGTLEALQAAAKGETASTEPAPWWLPGAFAKVGT